MTARLVAWLWQRDHATVWSFRDHARRSGHRICWRHHNMPAIRAGQPCDECGAQL